MLALAAQAARAEETVTTNEDITVSGTPWVVVQSAGGGISVRAGSDGIVHVEARRRAPTKEVAKALKVTAALDNGVVRITWADKKPNTSVQFIVTAPAPCRVGATTDGGGIDVSGMTGGVTATTRGGGINVNDSRGELTLKTSGGGIRATAVDGTLDARTSGGGIDVTGNLRGANNVASGGGGVGVRLSDKSKLRVEAGTQGGGASNDFGWPVENGHFKGQIGDGSSGSLRATTQGGGIHVGKL
jgi:hypothetical protein